MSIASAIQLKQQQVAEAYTAISNKGGTVPATPNVANLPTAINSIPSGSSLITKTFSSNGTYSASSYGADGFSKVTVSVPGSTLITKTITENGTYYASLEGADGFSQVEVNIPEKPYLPREISATGVYQMPTEPFEYSLPAGATDLGDYALSYAFYGSTGINGADFTGLTSITGEKALYMAFANTSIEDIFFYDLTATSFGSNTDQFNNMLYGVTGCEVHFPASVESTIDSWADVIAGFGGTNTVVLFDIVPQSEGE